ncbi:hypothetical protein [Segeticoccus rhizosphaerae]|uniref:hypothetical protein n=1 Tax=Segeticoccus rhizosphaerae TaxID=1104777 RepID=UPI00192E3332|nr:hypothetical protein [Ornithinicoccus soli]
MHGSDKPDDARKTSPGQHDTAAKPQRDPEAEYRRKRRIIRAGQALMGLGVLVGLQHFLFHLGTFGAQPSGWQDLLIGYPTAGVLVIAGAIAAGR